MNIFYCAQQLCIRHLISSQHFSYFCIQSIYRVRARIWNKCPTPKSFFHISLRNSQQNICYCIGFCFASSWIILFTVHTNVHVPFSHIARQPKPYTTHSTKKKNIGNCTKKICQSFAESMYLSAVGASKMAIIRITLSRPLPPPLRLCALLLPLVM